MRTNVISIFSDAAHFTEGVKRLNQAGLRDVQLYSPVGLPELEHLAPRRGSPVRCVVLIAGAVGLIGGLWMCIGSALLYSLILGGKAPEAIIPYCVIGFEVTVLVGGLAAILSIVGFGRLGPRPPDRPYDPRFGEDRFGICVYCREEEKKAVADLLRQAGAEEIHEQPEPDN